MEKNKSNKIKILPPASAIAWIKVCCGVFAVIFLSFFLFVELHIVCFLMCIVFVNTATSFRDSFKVIAIINTGNSAGMYLWDIGEDVR